MHFHYPGSELLTPRKPPTPYLCTKRDFDYFVRKNWHWSTKSLHARSPASAEPCFVCLSRQGLIFPIGECVHPAMTLFIISSAHDVYVVREDALRILFQELLAIPVLAWKLQAHVRAQ